MGKVIRMFLTGVGALTTTMVVAFLLSAYLEAQGPKKDLY